MYACMYGVCVGGVAAYVYGMGVEVRWQLLRAISLFLLCVLGTELR